MGLPLEFATRLDSNQLQKVVRTVNFYISQMGCDVRKPVFGGFNIGRLKPACSATETS